MSMLTASVAIVNSVRMVDGRRRFRLDTFSTAAAGYRIACWVTWPVGDSTLGSRIAGSGKTADDERRAISQVISPELLSTEY